MSFLLSVFYYVSNCAIYGNLVILPVLGVRYFVKCPSGYLRNIIYLLAGLRLCFPFLFYCPFAAFEGREVVTTYSVDFHYTTGVSLISIPHNASIVLSIIWIMGLAAIMAYRVIRFASQKSQSMNLMKIFLVLVHAIYWMNPLVWVLTRCMASDLACREDGTQLKSKESDSIERAKRIMIYVICVFVFFISVVVRESKLLWNDAVVMNVDDSKKYVYEEEAP